MPSIVPEPQRARSVLVADRNADVRQILVTFLESRGYAVAVARDATSALELVRTLDPDVILGEHPLRLPDGGALCEELRRDRATRSIPFVALTTAGSPDEVRAAHRTHPAGFVLKLYSTVMWSTIPWTKWGLPSPASGMKQMRP
jgi:CheY-like chemotaxis protein